MKKKTQKFQLRFFLAKRSKTREDKSLLRLLNVHVKTVPQIFLGFSSVFKLNTS